MLSSMEEGETGSEIDDDDSVKQPSLHMGHTTLMARLGLHLYSISFNFTTPWSVLCFPFVIKY